MTHTITRRLAAQHREKMRNLATAHRRRQAFTEPKCRVCGCTEKDCRGCIAKTGKPCHWVAPDLCSACAPETQQ